MKKILIVDDDPYIAEAVQITLESENYTCAVVHAAPQVIETVLSFRPNLIIMDIVLVGHSGLTIAKKLKSAEETQHIPIILFSAHQFGEKSAQSTGVEAFIPKPFDIEVLLATVKKYLL